MKNYNLNKTGKFLEFAVALVLILLGVGLRLLPHAPNFAPISAIALFGGVYLSRKIALLLPVLAMLVSDIFLGFYESKMMLAVYASFLLVVLLGFWLRSRKKWPVVLAGSLTGSLTFFLLTNFAVWSFSGWYVKTFSGLAQCYLMALPFFRNTLLSDLFYVVVFFGIYELAEVLIKRKFSVTEKNSILV